MFNLKSILLSTAKEKFILALFRTCASKSTGDAATDATGGDTRVLCSDVIDFFHRDIITNKVSNIFF